MMELSNTETSKIISRKAFLRVAAIGVFGLFAALWNAMSKQEKKLRSTLRSQKINIVGLSVGVHFIEDVIVVKQESSFAVFSCRCTHAGCIINHELDGRLVCPCHGSAFETATGKVLNGPAGLPLRQIEFETDRLTGEIILIQTR
jgi:Rieske Fe-S protein